MNCFFFNIYYTETHISTYKNNKHITLLTQNFTEEYYGIVT